MMQQVFIYGGLRSPIGRHAGALAKVRPDDLAAAVIKAVREKFPVTEAKLEDVILGCTNQAGEDSRNVARHAALLGGFPTSVPGKTVNRLCASGLQAVIDAAQAVVAGQGELFLAGGVENMSRAPFVVAKAESAFAREFAAFDTTLGARFPNPKIVAQYGAHTMPETAEEVAKDLNIPRDQADRFAEQSQRRYAVARERGFFAGEITPITIPSSKKGQEPTVVKDDEHPRPDSTFEQLSKLRPLHEGGVVTAGNASGINDGACALWIGGPNVGGQPMARILATAATGVDPRVMGLGPVTAIQKALMRANLGLKQMDVIEINEAFAAQVLGCCKQLGINGDDSRLNPNGGAIAIGHPLGASGARLLLTATRQLQAINGRYACVSLCIGVGQGLAVVIERVA